MPVILRLFGSHNNLNRFITQGKAEESSFFDGGSQRFRKRPTRDHSDTLAFFVLRKEIQENAQRVLKRRDDFPCESGLDLNDDNFPRAGADDVVFHCYAVWSPPTAALWPHKKIIDPFKPKLVYRKTTDIRCDNVLGDRPKAVCEIAPCLVHSFTISFRLPLKVGHFLFEIRHLALEIQDVACQLLNQRLSLHLRKGELANRLFDVINSFFYFRHTFT